MQLQEVRRVSWSLPLVREWRNGSNSSYNCTPFLHSLLTKGKGVWGLRFGVRGLVLVCRARVCGFGGLAVWALLSLGFRVFVLRSGGFPVQGFD